MRISFFLFLLAVVVMAGCKSSTSPGLSTTLVVPNAGSYFITVNTTTDSTGTMIYLPDTTKGVVLQTNAAIYGKTNVLVELDSDVNGWSTDTSYYHYESNGDVTSYMSNSPPIPNGWVTFPCASQTSSPWFNIVTSFSSNTSSRLIGKISGAGSGSLSIKGKSFDVEKLYLAVAETDTTFPANTTYSSNNVTTISFAPSLGYVVESDQPGIREYAGAPIDPSTHSQVIDYFLK